MASVIPYAMREILKRIVECSSNEDPDVRYAFWAAEKEYFDRYMNEKCVPKNGSTTSTMLSNNTRSTHWN